jgi:hypothetical protein
MRHTPAAASSSTTAATYQQRVMEVDAFLQRLGTACSHVAVHRDYLQRHVEQLEAVERQCRADDTEREHLEEQLDKAVSSAERVALMSNALETARQNSQQKQRRGVPRASEVSIESTATGVPSPQPSISSTTSMDDILKFSKAAEAFDGESNATQSILTYIESSQAQISRLEYKLHEQRDKALREKLARLETLKSACRGIDVTETLRGAFDDFQFSPAAEAYFFSGPPESKRRHSNSKRGISARREQRLVTSDMVASLLSHAVRRLTLRYKDAFNALVKSLESHRSTEAATPEHQQNDRLMYAVGFSQYLANPNAGAVQFASFLGDAVQNPRQALQDEYDALCRVWIATKPPPPAGNDVTIEGASALVGSQAHIVLPSTFDWWSNVLCTCSRAAPNATTEENKAPPPPPLLPPAKHILTQRFCAADVTELQSLERLRIQLQQCVLDEFLAIPSALATEIPRIERDWKRMRLLSSDNRIEGVWTVLGLQLTP